jgi:hypothetical protein
MNFFTGLLIFLIIAGLTAAIVTNYLGLYEFPGQCKKMCAACQGDDSGAQDKQTTAMQMPVMMF